MDRQRTIACISIQHTIDDNQFAFPILLPPAFTIHIPSFHGRLVWYMSKTPVSVIPDPVDLRVLLEEYSGQIKIIREVIVNLFRVTTVGSVEMSGL
jgi:hypothetical protein